MNKILITSTALLAATSALAGGPTYVPVPVAPIATPVIVTLPTWTGPYLGVQAGIGNGDLLDDGESVSDMSGPVYGLHGGYMYDFGSIVVGGEVDYNFADVSGDFDGGESITDLYHLKARAGYDAGSLLIYGTAGYAYASVEFDPSTTYDTEGVFYGVGAEYKISSNWTAGAEVLMHDLEDKSGAMGYDIDLTTVQARASYHF